MSLKCITVCAFLLVLGLGATWAERSTVLQPRPATKLKDIENLLKLSEVDDEDIGDESDEESLAEDELLEQDLDLSQLSEDELDEVNRLIDEIEAAEEKKSGQSSGRAASRRSGRRSTKRRSRRGRGNKARRGNRRTVKRGGNRRNRSGKRTRRVQK